MNDLESFAHQREVKQSWFDKVKTKDESPYHEEEIRILKEEISDLQSQHKECLE
jgi:hypothetical protein